MKLNGGLKIHKKCYNFIDAFLFMNVFSFTVCGTKIFPFHMSTSMMVSTQISQKQKLHEVWNTLHKVMIHCIYYTEHQH
jgi:hypothetical protein